MVPGTIMFDDIPFGGGGSGSSAIKAVYETSPAIDPDGHAIGDILWFSENTYQVIAPISQGDIITATGQDANIEPFNSTGVPVFVKNLPNSGGSSTLLKVDYVGATTTKSYAQGVTIYYINKFYKTKRAIDGTQSEYTIIPAEDLEASGLNGSEVISVNGIPGTGIYASEVVYGDTTVEGALDGVEEDITRINSDLTQSIDSIQTQIVPTASIESGETASKAYSAGDFLVKDGILYKVINDIAEGDTLTVGTNIDGTTVVDELSGNLTDKWTFTKLTDTDNNVTVPSGVKEFYLGGGNSNAYVNSAGIIPIELFNYDENLASYFWLNENQNVYIKRTSTENVYLVHRGKGFNYVILGYR